MEPSKVQIWHNCRLVKISRNLRGILEYARNTSDVESITVERLTDSQGPTVYPVTFIFRNGAECNVDWADWRVLADWIKARRAWDIDAIALHGLPEFLERMA